MSDGLEKLLDEATALFERDARPAALFQDVTPEMFARIYEGDGANAAETPLEEVFPRADALALFTATLGRRLDEMIRALFARGDPALGYVLDVTAGCAADCLAQLTADRFVHALGADRCAWPPVRALPYSPGYCGWHLSGQRALFDHVQPTDLGVGLTGSCLMDPIKSVSGVLVAGVATIHRFRPSYPFCESCRTHVCRERIKMVLGPRH